MNFKEEQPIPVAAAADPRNLLKTHGIARYGKYIAESMPLCFRCIKRQN